jgi:hypothetical protein
MAYIHFCLEYCCVLPKAKTKFFALYHGNTTWLQCLYLPWSHLYTRLAPPFLSGWNPFFHSLLWDNLIMKCLSQTCYQTAFVRWIFLSCPESCLYVQNLWISIDHCNVVCNFLLWPSLPHTSLVGGSPRRISIAATGTVLIAPVISKQVILCSLLSSAWLVLSSTPGHHSSIGNYGLYHCSVSPTYHNWFQPLSFPKCASACSEGLIGLMDNLFSE